VVQITNEDLDLIKNTRSRLPIGSHFHRADLMRLALMASDNRAASALGRNYPGGILAFVDAMNAKAKSLGLTPRTSSIPRASPRATSRAPPTSARWSPPPPSTSSSRNTRPPAP
jgi:hypothetical protein